MQFRGIVICCENHTTDINRLSGLVNYNSQFLAHSVLRVLYDSNSKQRFHLQMLPLSVLAVGPKLHYKMQFR